MQHTPSLTTILLMNDCGMHFMRKMHLEMAFIVIFCPILIEDYNVILWGELHTLKRWRADDALSLMNGLLKKNKKLHTAHRQWDNNGALWTTTKQRSV